VYLILPGNQSKHTFQADGINQTILPSRHVAPHPPWRLACRLRPNAPMPYKPHSPYFCPMRSVLTQPYPFFHRGKELLRNSALIFIIGFCFDYFFEPFNVNRAEHNYAYWVIVLAHVGGATAMYFIYFSIVNPFVDEDDWTVGKEALAVFVLLLIIGVQNFFWRDVIYDNPRNFSLHYFIDEIRNTLLAGSLIVFLVLTVNFNILKRRNMHQATHLHPAKPASQPSGQVSIQAAIPSDNFDLDPSHVLCVRADGNYVEFFVREGDETKKLIKRLTLQYAADQLAGFPFIQKTHRAYLVNTQQVNRVEGNAQGYQLTVDQLPFPIPVSRKHIGSFSRIMQ
jgi:hypothetical protein